jgi:aerobic-type carbon monoxide dehydrogenase small subunit (CoxS/CutS family)
MTKDHHDDPSGASRRSFLKGVGLAAGAASLPLAVPPAGASDVPGDLPDGLKYYPARAQEITLEINGKQEKLTVEPRTSLLSALREHLGLTGAKEVCDRGSCGCCTVQLDGVSVCSCLMMAMEAEGASITTIEGLAADEANTEMIDHLCSHDAAQCGFCIPGFVVRGEEVLREADGALDDQAIREGLSGNICRCGTYYKLFDGFKAASGGEVNRILANNVTLEDERPRADVREKLTGSAKYTADMFPEKIIYARFIRFPHGAGKVASIDAEAARKIPGVLKVHLDEDKKEARYTSERLGYIVAVSREIISDAMIALKMRVKLDREIATNPDDYYSGPPETNSEDSQQLAALYNKAAAVVESEYRTQVQTHSSLETHGSLVDYKGDSADVWASTQGTFSVANEIGEPMGLETSQVTVNCEFIGGGFGSKFGVNPEDALAARLSKEFGRPCKVMLDRKEEHTDAGNRPGSIQYMKIAADEKGKILGGRIHVASTVGYRKGGGGAKNPRWYDFGDVVRTEEEILLAAGTPRAFRAPGHPQGCFAVESMIDELAGKLGLDPMDVRLLNEEVIAAASSTNKVPR